MLGHSYHFKTVYYRPDIVLIIIGSQVNNKDFILAQLQLRQRRLRSELSQVVYSHSSLLNNLPSSNPGSDPIQEEAVSIQKGADAETSPAGTQGEVCVASFPSMISHKHFLDEDIVKQPFLTLVFTVAQYSV